MQLETLHNLPQKERKQYLRVATISNKTAYCYFYIGNDDNSLQFLAENFRSGFIAADLDEAKEELRTHAQQDIDVLIIDVPYHYSALKEFHSFLKNRGMQSIPI